MEIFFGNVNTVEKNVKFVQTQEECGYIVNVVSSVQNVIRTIILKETILQNE